VLIPSEGRPSLSTVIAAMVQAITDELVGLALPPPAITVLSATEQPVGLASLVGFGLICFTGFGGIVRGLGVSQNPDVDFPIVNIALTYEGASPEIMESDVVDFIEDAVTSIEGVKQISSTSRQGSASVNIEFDLKSPLNPSSGYSSGCAMMCAVARWLGRS